MQKLDESRITQIGSLADNASLEGKEAALEAMFLISAADGEVSEIEVETFARACKRLGIVMSEEALEARFLELATAIEKDGWDARVAVVGKSLAGTPHAEIAYRLAVSIALSDDYVVGEEIHAIDALGAALGLDADRAHVILREVHDALFPG